MAIKDKYLSIASPSEGLYKDKGSRFIALAYPVGSEAEAKSIIDAGRKEYHDARHCCFAYRIGPEGAVWRSGDDGEPAGTAGRQILGRIDSAGLSDILVIVVRYFGGILLGVPGLIAAYKASAADAIRKAEKIEKTATRAFGIEFDYAAMPSVMKTLKDMGLPQKNQSFGLACSVETRVPLSLSDDFLDRLSGIAAVTEINNHLI